MNKLQKIRLMIIHMVIFAVIFPNFLYGRDDSTVVERYFQNARSLYALGNYEQAEEDFNLIIERYPDTLYAGKSAIILSEYYFAVKMDFEKAFDYIQKTIHISRDEEIVANAYFLRGKIHLTEGQKFHDSDKAIADLLRIINIYPDSSFRNEAVYFCSLLFERAGQINRAIWFLENYLFNEGPTSPYNPYKDLVRLYIKNIQYDRALLSLSKSFDYISSPADLKLSKAYATLMIRLLKFKADGSGQLYTAEMIEPDIRRARIVACNSDLNSYFFLDSRNNNLVKFSKDLVFEKEIVSDLNNPVDFYFDPLGRIVINDRRRVYIDNKYYTLERQERQLRDIKSIFFDSFGNIYVFDGNINAVIVFDGDGRYQRDIFTGYIAGNDLMAVDLFDRVFIVSERSKNINVFSVNGEFLFSRSMNSPDYKIEQPADIFVDILGNLYVLDRIGALWIYDYNIELVSKIDLNKFEIDRPQKMGIMPDGSISVIDRRNNVFILK